jgi:hypothetical protein
MKLLTVWRNFLEAVKKYVLSDYLKKLVVSYAVKALGISSSFGSWLAVLVVKKMYDIGTAQIKKEITKEETKLDNAKDNQKYDTIIKDSNSTADDIKNAAPDFLGGTVTKPK